jgi:hypothetical protein
MDNIIAIQRSNSGSSQIDALAAALSADFDVVDYNDYFTPQGNVAMIGTSTYPTLAMLKAIPSWTGRDANSIVGNPKWASNTDLHWTSYTSAIIKKGQYLSTVPIDIDYSIRATAPKADIGADENGLNGVLPVELMSLDARGLDSKVDVSFETANEKDLFGFALLRSDGDDEHFVEIANAFNAKALTANGSDGHSTNYNFADNTVTNGTTYFYKVVGINNDGTRQEFARIAEATPIAPEQFAIVSNYPNPLSLSENASTKIAYSIGAPSAKVELTIVDLTGRTVRALFDGPVENAGVYTVQWDAKEADGSIAPSGTYFATLHVITTDGNAQSATLKIVLTK